MALRAAGISAGAASGRVAVAPISRTATSLLGTSLRTHQAPPAAAVANTLDRPDVRSSFDGREYHKANLWQLEEQREDQFSQYSDATYVAATTAVNELRDLTSGLMSQLVELEKASQAFDTITLDTVAPSSSVTTPVVDKQARKPKRVIQRGAVRRGLEDVADVVSSRPRSETGGRVALRTAEPEVPDAGQNQLGLVQLAPKQQTASSTPALALDSSEAALELRRQSGSAASASLAQDEPNGSLNLPLSLGLGSRALPSGSILLSQRKKTMTVQQQEDADSLNGQAVASEWGTVRQTRRNQIHGRQALKSTVRTAALRREAAVAERAQASSTRSSSSSEGSMSSFMKEASSRELLTSQEEKRLMIQVADWRFLQGAATQIRAVLQREPTDQEWAMTVKTDILTLHQRLSAGSAARETMVHANYRLVVANARRFIKAGRELSDLIATGVAGLYKAVDRFEADKGFRFSTYSTWWIRQAIMRSLTDQGRTLRLPSHIVEHVTKLKVVYASKTAQLGRAPTAQELSKEMGLSVEKVKHLQSVLADSSSLDAPAPGMDEGDSPKDTLEDFRPHAGQHLENEAIVGDLSRMLDCLDEREANVLRMRYGLTGTGVQYTLEHIGKHLKVTRERVRQIEAKAISKLRLAAQDPDSVVGEYVGTRETMECAARNSRGTKKT